jgi:hypothetical protein
MVMLSAHKQGGARRSFSVFARCRVTMQPRLVVISCAFVVRSLLETRTQAWTRIVSVSVCVRRCVWVLVSGWEQRVFARVRACVCEPERVSMPFLMPITLYLFLLFFYLKNSSLFFFCH